MDDDYDFLYGGGDPQPKATPIPVTPSTSLGSGSFQSTEGIIAQLEAQAAEASTSQVTDVSTQETAPEDEDAVDMGEETEEEDDEDDVEIIMEPQSRSLDFRQSASARPTALRASASSSAIREQAPQPTPQQTYSGSEPPPAAPADAPADAPPQTQAAHENAAATVDDGIDPSTLPAVPAPPSHPTIDPSAMGTVDGRAIIDVDLGSMADKQWRKPGSDISDWFNYGFDELSWEAYCYRRRDLGELANVLKTNVLNFSGMAEDQLTALPPEVRQMVMTGTTAMMNGAGNPAMMNPGMMMDMSGMMGPMGMGMNGDMGMNGGMMQMGMQDGGQAVGNGGTGTPEQQGMMQEGFVGNPAMMGMGMEYSAQEQNQMAQQQMYPQMDAPQASPPTGPIGRGAAVPYRGRALRGVRGFPGRGRGRGYGGDAPPVPVRPTSPLPPNVPTGPRNQNKYKDRDGNAPAVDGLDYGGTKDGRTPSGEPEERSRCGCRKRRSSPSLDDVRGSKRR
ncbi:hypothetical protein DFH07DRAFT_903975 [Mycena maculata]|uniref:Pre-mRNA polyadenylation factor Fip1 domain-containing protein n=1 Tax=Mycena maculata TaxID=230809 RepID=A0AAD7NCF9_9AGAR|nr:hypothetical protein DFH07DRAFT_903975 [Mycena maculata]